MVSVWEYCKNILSAKDIEETVLLFSTDVELTEPPKWLLSEPLPENPSRRIFKKSNSEVAHFNPNLFQDPTIRARLLLSFANHELLAVELMALAILKFSDAPKAFLRGLIETMKDEQVHFTLYRNRAEVLGATWNEEESSWFFWDALKSVQSPLEFVTAMSLTLEQANLDFAKFYAEQFRTIGDLESASILERVFQDEISHVKFGYHWFQKWSEEESSDLFESHRKHLVAPLTLARAKGKLYLKEVREEIGFPSDYIERLKSWGGSKGRPPVLWYYNPGVEFEFLNPPRTLNSKQLRVVNDLEHVLLWLAKPQDQIRSSCLPSTEFLKSLSDLNLDLPEFYLKESPVILDKIAGVSPWGWSPVFYDQVQELKKKQVRVSAAPPWLTADVISGLACWHSKAYQQSVLGSWLESNQMTPSFSSKMIQSESEWETSLNTATFPLMLKSSIGVSGSQVRKILDLQEFNSESTQTWVRRTLNQAGSLLVEPYCERVMDYSIQAEVDSENVKILGLREFWVGRNHEYKGTFLDPKLSRHSGGATPLIRENQKLINEWVRYLGKRLREDGYLGPFGVDGFVYRESGKLQLRLMSELNLRYTFGRIALEVEKKLLKGRPGIMELVSIDEFNQQKETPNSETGVALTDWVHAQKWVLITRF